MTSLGTTFQFLARTENEAAVDVLLAGLDCPAPATRQGAMKAILERRNPQAHREVFRRLATLDEQAREIINERPDRLVGAVSDALQDSSPEVCAAACNAIVSFRLYDAISPLVAALVDEANPHASLVAEAILKLTESFYAELSGAEDQPKRKNQDMLRDRVTASLEDAVRKFHRHRREEAVEALLMIAKQKNVVLRQLLQRPEESSYQPILDVLSRSSQGGVVRLLLGFLEDPQMPRAVVEVISHRVDAKFVDHLAHTVGPRPSRLVLETLTRFDRFDWAEPERQVLDELGDEAQQGAVQLLMTTAMDRERLLGAIGHLLSKGKVGGRRAAAKALASFDGPVAAALAIQAVNDEDSEVRACIVRQLRQRKIPGAFSLLIRMVDSSEPEVQEALRDAMPEFNFRQFLANFDVMPEALKPITGHMVGRLDQDSVAKLEAEMNCPSPVRRRRAVQAAGAMGVVAELEKTIIQLLADEDHMVRVAVAKAMADLKTMPTWDALRDALLDRSVIVQEAAERSLERIAESLCRQAEQRTVPENDAPQLEEIVP